MLLGFGIFNFVEGVVNHHWLGIHHVNETVPKEQLRRTAGYKTISAMIVATAAMNTAAC
jgi:uncharacterized membrane protein